MMRACLSVRQSGVMACDRVSNKFGNEPVVPLRKLHRDGGARG